MKTNEILKEVYMAAEKINQFLETELNGKIEPLWSAGRHYIKAGGKRLRPYIVMKVIEMLENKSDIDEIIPIASAVEVLHNFTLIHDDIMDNDPFRRGIPTVHTKWNESTAILSGDLLFGMVFLFVMQSKIPDKPKTEIAKYLAIVSKELCEGQMMDINFETQKEVSLGEYFEMIRLKTGALFRTSACIGGICANATEEQLISVGIYGESMGIAFQLVDDILGIIADEKEFGKPVGSDIREGKKTYIYLKALENLPPKESQELKEIYQKTQKFDREISRATQLLMQSHAMEMAKDEAKKYMNTAIESLRKFSDNKARFELETIARITVDRNY